ncbi:MAG TPA: XRE family transcriptional regulator [Pseudolabrys sp.]
MPAVNAEILSWARETAGLSIDEASRKLGIREARGVTAAERLAALESGNEAPRRSILAKMAKLYRRPMLVFYMNGPPPKGDRGEDFRNVPQRHSDAEPLVDALVRDIKARQSMVHAILEDDDETEPLPFIGSMNINDGIGAVLASIRQTLQFSLPNFRMQGSVEGAFTLLRNQVETAGVFVLLIGNLGSHHTAIDVSAFRGFALADRIAPFIVINDQDAKSAWSFTLIHELTHLWLGTTGVSGSFADGQIERFCNDVASNFLLPTSELDLVGVDRRTNLQSAATLIGRFAGDRLLGRSMVAYRLFRAGMLFEATWRALADQFESEWRQTRADQRERSKEQEGGPNYYVVRRHRLGGALLQFVARNMSEGSLTPTKAGKVLGVKPRSVAPLLKGAALPVGEVA